MNFFKQTSGFTRIVDSILTSLIINVLLRPDFVAYKFSDRSNWPFRICTGFWKTQKAAWTITDTDDYQTAKENQFIIIFEDIKPGS